MFIFCDDSLSTSITDTTASPLQQKNRMSEFAKEKSDNDKHLSAVLICFSFAVARGIWQMPHLLPMITLSNGDYCFADCKGVSCLTDITYIN